MERRFDDTVDLIFTTSWMKDCLGVFEEFRILHFMGRMQQQSNVVSII